MQAALDQVQAGMKTITTLIKTIRDGFLSAGLSEPAADEATLMYMRKHLFKPTESPPSLWNGFGK